MYDDNIPIGMNIKYTTLYSKKHRLSVLKNTVNVYVYCDTHIKVRNPH